MKKKILVAFGMAALLTGSCMSAFAAEEAELTPGVTVAEDADSPTGYTVTFVYEAADATEVTLTGAFTFYNLDESIRGKTPEEYITPYDWENNGMFEAGDESYSEAMTKVEGTDYWTISLPLPCGHYQYVFHVDGAEEKLEDPTNPMEASGVENGMHYDRSTFYVPYDAEKQSEAIDFSYMAPREDGKSGEVTYVNYTDCNGEAAPLGVYLPYGFDADREEPYKVLYLSHGGGGNETDWFAGGSVDYIFDNMIAGGTVEPTVLITMNNTAYEWNFDVVIDNLTNNIIPYVEENYNVCSEASGKAFAGLSMGGMTTSNVLYNCADQFGYFGIMSGADVGKDFSTLDIEKMKEPVIMLGAGVYDFGLEREIPEGQEDGFTVKGLSKKLDDNGISYGWEEALGSHDWNTWPQLIKVFAEEYLWK